MRGCTVTVALVMFFYSTTALADGCLLFDPGSSIADRYVPITPEQRTAWIACGTIGVSSLAIGVFNASFPTRFNTLEDWRRAQSGFVSRFGHRELDVSVSNGLEGGLGAVWGEEPRYIKMGISASFWRRFGYSLETIVVAQRPGGQLAPAWGRYAANVATNAIDTVWLPPEATGWRHTVQRNAESYLVGRAANNFWAEFGDDIKSGIATQLHRVHILPERR